MSFTYYLLSTGRLLTAFLTGFAAGCLLEKNAEQQMLRKGNAGTVILRPISEKEKMQAVMLMALGSIFLLWKEGANGNIFFYWLFFCVLFVAGYVDHFIQIIPNEMVLLALLLWSLRDICLYQSLALTIQEVFVAVLFSLGIFLVVVFLESRNKKQMFGRGDIKLLFVAALFFGFEKSLYILAFACICFMVTYIFQGKKIREEYIPFGPYIGLSCFLMMIL